MNINDFLGMQNEAYLKMCFEELEDFRVCGVLKDGEIRKLNNHFFNNNPTTLFTIGELVYREIAIRHFIDENRRD